MEQEDDFTLQLVLASDDDEYEGDGYSFRDEKPMIAGNDMGRAELRLEEVKLRRGEHYVAQYTFYNTNCSYWIYNPSFHSNMPVPGQPAIYDADKKYLGELKYGDISHMGPGRDSFVFLWAGMHIGAKIGFRAGYPSESKYRQMGNLLPAGRYYIQLILYRAFLTDYRYMSGEKTDFNKTFDRSVLCRSNVIEIELID